MDQKFQKIMRQQVQEELEPFADLIKKNTPRNGWINIIRQTLGMSRRQLAKQIGCSAPNITALERREKDGKITVEKLNQIAEAMHCRCVYFFIPNKPLDQILYDQALIAAKKQLQPTAHSMELEQQGLSSAQKKQLENDMVQDMLLNNSKKIWSSDDEI